MAFGSGAISGSCGGIAEHDKQSLESLNAFNTFIINGSACHLNLRISDPWTSTLHVRLVTTGSRPLPEQINCNPAYITDSNPVTRADLFNFGRYGKKQCTGPGMYRFNGLRSGKYILEIEWGPDRRWELWKTITIGGSSIKEITIHLELASIQGTIVDRTTSRPISDADIKIKKVYKTRRLNVADISTGEDGQFLEKEIPAGIYDLTIRHPSYHSLEVKNFQVHDNADMFGLIFELDPIASRQ